MSYLSARNTRLGVLDMKGPTKGQMVVKVRRGSNKSTDNKRTATKWKRLAWQTRYRRKNAARNGSDQPRSKS